MLAALALDTTDELDEGFCLPQFRLSRLAGDKPLLDARDTTKGAAGASRPRL